MANTISFLMRKIKNEKLRVIKTGAASEPYGDVILIYENFHYKTSSHLGHILFIMSINNSKLHFKISSTL